MRKSRRRRLAATRKRLALEKETIRTLSPDELPTAAAARLIEQFPCDYPSTGTGTEPSGAGCFGGTGGDAN